MAKFKVGDVVRHKEFKDAEYTVMYVTEYNYLLKHNLENREALVTLTGLDYYYEHKPIPQEITGWVNVYRFDNTGNIIFGGHVYNNQEAAVISAWASGTTRIATIPVSFTEDLDN